MLNTYIIVKAQVVVFGICNKAIKQSSLAGHKKRFHNEEQQPEYNCNICTFKTIYQRNLKTHIVKIHKNSYP